MNVRLVKELRAWKILFLSFLNDIKFRGLFNAKAILEKEQQYNHLTLEDKEVHIFPKGISSKEGARGVMVIVVGNGHSNKSSNPGQD